jgi:glucokinase
MYLAIDIGGSKTLLAVFDDHGNITDKYKIPTNKDYSGFIAELQDAISNKLGHHAFAAICCAVPGKLDKDMSVVQVLGNLPWRNKHIKRDIELIVRHTPVFLQNDAKLAGLAEALVHPKYHKVLYLTVSTGIGDGIIIDGKIDPNFTSSEPGQMMVEFDNRIQKWEDFASGRALVAKYGKRASDIEDPKIWKHFAKGLARGMNELIAILQPDVIILGGGVGAHFEKFSAALKDELKDLSNEMVPTPPVIKAKHAEEAVIYGCYEYIKQNV